MSPRWLLLPALLVAHASALACSCAVDGGPADAMRRSDEVFVGTVGAIADADPAAEGSPRRIAVDFVTRSALKGGGSPSQRVLTNAHTASCGFPFEQGRTYVVYAVATSEGLATSGCSRTHEVRTPDQALKSAQVDGLP